MFKEIELSPTDLVLDVYYGKQKHFAKESTKRYGFDINADSRKDYIAYVTDVWGKRKSEIGKRFRILLYLPVNNYKESILVHELIHILHHLCQNSGISVNYESQEWEALMTEHLFEKIKILYK